jgi:hypothetical protein
MKRPMKRERQVIDISRRQMLRGIGGATLALPVLPSLLCKTAYAADPVSNRACSRARRC